MKRILHVLFALLAVGFLTGFALAADAASQGFDLGSWFVDAASLAVVVVAVVAFLREHPPSLSEIFSPFRLQIWE